MNRITFAVGVFLAAIFAALPNCGAQSATHERRDPKLVTLARASWSEGAAKLDPELGEIRGTTRDAGASPLAQVGITLHSIGEGTDRRIISGNDGSSRCRISDLGTTD